MSRTGSFEERGYLPRCARAVEPGAVSENEVAHVHAFARWDERPFPIIVKKAWTHHPGVITIAAIVAVEESPWGGDLGMAANIHLVLASVVKEDFPAAIQ